MTTHSKIILGVDPDTKGAIAGIQSWQVAWAFKVPLLGSGKASEIDYHGLQDLLMSSLHMEAYIEIQHPSGGELKTGRIANFRIGGFYLSWRLFLRMMEIPIFDVRASDWQKVAFRGLPKPTNRIERKKLSVKVAQDHFPHIKGLKHTDGRADALNIAWYGWQQNRGE